jgi:L-alanine-DL-glutamate epimerase-like enolase superfamily enzyme
MPVATHNVAGPIATIASANFAASVREFVAHEAFVSNPMNRDGRGINGDPEVLGYDKEMIVKGHIQLSDRPGFGIELNEKLIRERYLVEGEKMWS